MDHCVYDDAPAQETIDKVMLATTSKIDPSMITDKPSSVQAECFADEKAPYKEETLDEEPSIYRPPPASTFAAPNDSNQPTSRRIRLPDLSRGVRVSYCHYVLMLLSVFGLFACLVTLGFLGLARGAPTPIVVTNSIGFGMQSSPLLLVNEQAQSAFVSTVVFSQTSQAEPVGVLMSRPTISAIHSETTRTTFISGTVLASPGPPIPASASLDNQTQSSIGITVLTSSTVSSLRPQSSSPVTKTSSGTILSTSFSGPSIVTTTLVTSVTSSLSSRRSVILLTRSFTGPGLVGQILGSQ